MNVDEFRVYLKVRGYDRDTVDSYVNGVEKAQGYFGDRPVGEVDVDGFKEYVAHLLEKGENTEGNLVGLARYVYSSDMKDQWIYFAAILGGREVFPSIEERLENLTDRETAEKIFSNIDVPELGEGPGLYPIATNQLMVQLRSELPDHVWKRVLAGNHHRIPLESFARHKKWLEEAGSVDAWLKQMHEKAVKELDEHCRENRIWYEQVITPKVVEYVRSSQEILSGVRNGDWIYNTKFPYSPNAYLSETDPDERRYLMCHCVLAREAVKSGAPDIPMEWCYCSAGYGKLRYDVAFGVDTDVEVIESVFSGSDKCRFRFKIPEKFL
ncbi:hypothetical protein HOD50_12010 [Candidatus Bathyarchaeota archaeon]|nr:hypothetical protein [Candidatus Bathyarchaeota archaeon]